jgi:hypothetical protein
VSAARRLLGRAVKVAEVPQPTREEAPKSRKPAGETGRASSSSKATPRRPSKAGLSQDEVARARASASSYDRARAYAVGDYFLHAKFGVGRVEELTREGFVMVLFEDGEPRRLLHARP